jgi:uncharacterized protein with von Willebrand factor type A (vWA) domain
VEATLSDFIRVLRAAGVRVSISEAIDAHHAVQRVGPGDRALLKTALGLTLAKTGEERTLLDGCFERFFTFQELVDHEPTSAGQSFAAAATTTEQRIAAPEALPANLSALSEQLLQQDWAALNVAVAAAGQQTGANKIVSFTQRCRYTLAIAEAMGLQEVNADIARLAAGDDAERDAAGWLERARALLLERARDHVERQIGLFADPETRRWMRERLPQKRLSAIDRYYYQDIQDLVRRMAKRLVAMNDRRKKSARRGQLDFLRTLRSGLAYDGVPFEPRWRQIKKDRPRVMVLCDVSGSVAAVLRFLLMFLYGVSETLPKVRSFAFSDSLEEVTELFEQRPLEEAVALTLKRLGERSSSYGTSLADFERIALDDIDNRTTVIVLGDARSNYGDPGLGSLRKVYQRARQVIWLNPEPRTAWGYGDSEMPLLATACHHVRVCNTLKHLEQLVEELLRSG